jgi:hypothetical protein
MLRFLRMVRRHRSCFVPIASVERRLQPIRYNGERYRAEHELKTGKENVRRGVLHVPQVLQEV